MESKNCLKCCICFLILYMVQFVVFPCLIPNYYPSSNNAVFLFAITALLSNIIIIGFITEKKGVLVISDFFYGVCICCFNRKGMYGIGRIGMNLDGLQSRVSFKAMVFSSLIIVLLFWIVQLLMLLLKRIIDRRKMH